MRKWTKTRRDPARTYIDEEKVQRQKRMLARIHELVDCGIDAEPEVIAVAKAADPDVAPEKLEEVVTRFRAAVYGRQRGL
jgi:hypothetical protein